MSIRILPTIPDFFPVKWGAVIVAVLGFLPLKAQDFPTVEFLQYATGFSSPIDIVGSPFGNNDLYVVQQGTAAGNAQIKIIASGAVLSEPFLTITGISCCGERGLLSMVFHPGVQTNGVFFVFYTASGNGALTLARYKLKNVSNFYEADPDSRQVILSIPHPNNSNHNGGKLLFGPDGYLYLGTGDGGASNDPPGNAQNPQSLLGKILRINPSLNSTAAPHYTIPADNPFVAPGDGIADEIFAFGMRNPWRWSFDRSTGNAWIADVGQGAWEELNMVTPAAFKGANFGWRCFEGTSTNNATGIQPCSLFNGQTHTMPGFVYPHNSSTGGYSVTGGYVYRGDLYPKLKGFYLMADYISGAVWAVRTDGSFQASRQTVGLPPNIAGFGETANGEMWAVSLTQGNVYSIKAEGTLSAARVLLSGKTIGNRHILEWKVFDGTIDETYSIEAADDPGGLYFKTITTIRSKGTDSQNYSFMLTASGKALYRIVARSGTGNPSFSNTLALDAPTMQDEVLIALHGSSATVLLTEPAVDFMVTDISGRRLVGSKIPSGANIFTFELPQNHSGLLFLVVQTKSKIITRKLLGR